MDKGSLIRSSGMRIAILCGGTGTEREVSLVSGNAVHSATTELGLPCDLFDLTRDALPDGLDPSVHLVLPIVHGTFGEDGRLSALLEQGGFAFAGCDMPSSALCFDKYACKAVAARLDVPVARDYLIQADQPSTYAEIRTALGTKMILKPRLDGSSVGLHLINDETGYLALREDLSLRDYLAESYIEGHDLTVGVLDGNALGVVAVFPESGLYDYEHKYTSGLSRYEVPAQLDTSLAEQLAIWSAQIFRACGCRDLARVDFRLGADNQPVFLEINTLPGMTPTSLFPKSASCMGLDFESLVLEWIGFALAREEERRVF